MDRFGDEPTKNGDDDPQSESTPVDSESPRKNRGRLDNLLDRMNLTGAESEEGQAEGTADRSDETVAGIAEAAAEDVSDWIVDHIPFIHHEKAEMGDRGQAGDPPRSELSEENQSVSLSRRSKAEAQPDQSSQPLPNIQKLRELRQTEKARENSGRKLWVAGTAIAALILLSMLLIGVGDVGALLSNQEPDKRVLTGGVIHLSDEDAKYLNRIYGETGHEVAYCGILSNDEPPRMDIWMADTVNAGAGHIQFFTENCPGQVQDVLLHTHPNGNLRLSELDEGTLAERPENIMCVQGGQLATRPGQFVEDLACYQDELPNEPGVKLTRITVIVGNSDEPFD